jgi:hypothetical protein
LSIAKAGVAGLGQATNAEVVVRRPETKGGMQKAIRNTG